MTTARDTVSSQRLALVGAISVVLTIALRNAWCSDDSFITLRTVQHFVEGRGLIWNPGERVQAYTHPLWMFVLSAGYALTHEATYTTMALCMGATTLAVLVLALRVALTPLHGFVALALLGCSRSFIDYSTSGLENPLTHLLLACFVLLYVLKRGGSLLGLSLVVALLGLTRIDAGVMIVPAMLHEMWLSLRERGFWRTLQPLLLGSTPLVLWEVFSFVYYGFPLPNTAYAKLASAIPAGEYRAQGLMYFVTQLDFDAVTLAGILIAVALAFWMRSLRHILLALGALLYCVYTVRVGGDFMAGRFMSGPLFLSACVLASVPLRFEEPWTVTAAVVPLAMLGLSSRGLTMQPPAEAIPPSIDRRGVADERSFYYPNTGLLLANAMREMPDHPWFFEGRKLGNARRRDDSFSVIMNMGYWGYGAEDGAFLIDEYGLTDAFVARFPAQRAVDWRPGHILRVLPEGYATTMRNLYLGKPFHCEMRDQRLCTYLEKLVFVTRGPLWSLERLKEAAKLSAGRYDYLVDRQRYRLPDLVTLDLHELSTRQSRGAPWYGPGAHSFKASGLDVRMPQVMHAGAIDISLDGYDEYRVHYLLGTREVGLDIFGPAYAPGFALYMHRVPTSAQEKGFDRIRIFPLNKAPEYAVGHVFFH